MFHQYQLFLFIQNDINMRCRRRFASGRQSFSSTVESLDSIHFGSKTRFQWREKWNIGWSTSFLITYIILAECRTIILDQLERTVDWRKWLETLDIRVSMASNGTKKQSIPLMSRSINLVIRSSKCNEISEPLHSVYFQCLSSEPSE